MPKRLEKVDRKYLEKLAHIRKTNVQRHAGYLDSQLLRRNILRAQQNNTYVSELGRLQAATVKGPLQPHAEKKLADLKNVVKNVGIR